MKSGVEVISLKDIHIIQLKQLFERMAQIKEPISKDLVAELEARISIGTPSISNDNDKPYSVELAKLIECFFSEKLIFKLIRLSVSDNNSIDFKRFIEELLLYRSEEFITPGLLSEAVLINAIGVAKDSLQQNRYFSELRREHEYALEVLVEYFGKEFVNRLLAQQRTLEDENLQMILDELLADNEPLPPAAPSDDSLIGGFNHMRIGTPIAPGFNNHVAAAQSSEQPSFQSDRIPNLPKL